MPKDFELGYTVIKQYALKDKEISTKADYINANFMWAALVVGSYDMTSVL